MKNIKDFDSFLNESSDDDLLTAKQKKLPEGLKKGIIKKLKASGKKAGDNEDEDIKDEKDEKTTDKKDEKDDKKDDSSKSDEDKYLSAKQKKLPDGLKKGIIARAKKPKK